MRWLMLSVASPSIGLGHVSRTGLLAAAAAAQGVAVDVVVPPGSQRAQHVAGHAGVWHERPWHRASLAPFVAGSATPDVVVLDAPDEVLDGVGWISTERSAAGRPLVAAFRMYGVAGPGLPPEDVSLTPSFAAPASRASAPGGRRWRHVTGRELILVRERCFAPPDQSKDRPERVLITMGGADPAGLTALACEACDASITARATVTVVVGALDPRWPQLEAEHGGRLQLLRQGDVDFDDLLRRSAVAVIAGGLTRYECIAARTPFVALSATPEQAAFTRLVVEAGFGVHAGVGSELSSARVRAAVAGLLDDASGRNTMAELAPRLLQREAPARLCRQLNRWQAQAAVRA